METDGNNKTVLITIEGGEMYIDTSRNHYIPAFLYYLLEAYQCDTVSFKNTKRVFNKQELKNAKDWKELM